MPQPSKGPRLGGSPSHERLILANLATALFEHGRITTTESRAKRLRPVAERLVTIAKQGDLHARRNLEVAIEALALMGITNEGRDIPVRQLAREDGESRLVVSLTNIRKIHDLVFMRRQGDVLLIHLADTAFKRLGSVRYPRNGKPSAIADEAFAERDFRQQVAFWIRATPARP